MIVGRHRTGKSQTAAKPDPRDQSHYLEFSSAATKLSDVEGVRGWAHRGRSRRANLVRPNTGKTPVQAKSGIFVPHVARARTVA